MQDIFDVQHQWVEALVKADTATLDAILVDSYVDTDEGGTRYKQTGAFQGQSIAPKILFTATLIFQNGKWRAVAAHRTTMPDH